MFEKILVALDESDHAKAVVDAATELAKKSGSEVHVVHVLETAFVGKAGNVNMEDSSAAHRFLDEMVARFTSAGVTASGTVRASMHGWVAREVADEATRFGATVIVMGTRGLGEFGGMMLGSTTHKLLHVAAVPVLVIP